VYQRDLKVSGIEYIEAIAAAHAAGRLRWIRNKSRGGLAAGSNFHEPNGAASKASLVTGGTDGSNPLSSSGESDRRSPAAAPCA
jgi:hypothetical protein